MVQNKKHYQDDDMRSLVRQSITLGSEGRVTEQFRGLFNKIMLSWIFCTLGVGTSYADETSIQVKAFELPVSSFLSNQTRQAIKTQTEVDNPAMSKIFETCGELDGSNIVESKITRLCQAQSIYKTAFYKRFTDLYDVAITPRKIAGVYTEVIVPKGGVSDENKNRILINLHGGSMKMMARYGGRIESIPIASVGNIRVVSIDYRMAPEYKYPAATEDVIAVYRKILEDYAPENIGIYGCSAGGMLTARSIALFQKEKLPLPGAVGMLCGAASRYGGDSQHMIMGGLYGKKQEKNQQPSGYFEGENMDDPLITPALSEDLLAKFPPSLLISSTRDMLLSSVLHTHQLLTKLGVEADLHVWEGMDHAFLIWSPDFVESREAYDVVTNFFDKHLGR
ncbi:alpha/beta hydrolase [Porticoccaceae bacterium]|nr:alpha/beta hydrolase [Porticoccaceae bacterium]